MSMVEVKVSELSGAALDYMVATVEQLNIHSLCRDGFAVDCEDYSPSTDWGQGGPLIENYWHDIDTVMIDDMGPGWPDFVHGDMLLRLFCRAIVAAKLGEVVSIPAELVNT